MGEHRFQTEVGRVLSLVVNSLYSNEEIFLRELLSNASDALDKLRFRAITEPDLLAGDPSLVVRLRPDPERNVLVIEDTGIGMTEPELVENLGTPSATRMPPQRLSSRGNPIDVIYGIIAHPSRPAANTTWYRPWY